MKNFKTNFKIFEWIIIFANWMKMTCKHLKNKNQNPKKETILLRSEGSRGRADNETAP